MIRFIFLASCALVSLPLWANTLQTLQTGWAQAMYQVEPDKRVDALTILADEARAAEKTQPGNAEILIWKGIIVSSLAGEQGGLGALALAKEAKASLEEALTIDQNALNGSAYTSLGTLHHKVPGWPIGFGSDKKARKLLEQALAVNPQGIDSNYFMGEFLFDEGEYREARKYLTTASQAPDRPGRDLADSGRRMEIQALLARLGSKLE
jgi:tetratricopeptide (TPR) repeat protein